VKRLPFERELLLAYERCSSCDGAGVVGRAATNAPRTCWNCRGIGRKISRDGRELFYEVCELLGKPVTEKESRVRPKHLQTIFARDVRPGMYVKPMRSRATKPRVVEAVERLASGWIRLRYVDGAHDGVSDIESFERELTDAEISAAQELMASHIGNGAVNAPAATEQRSPRS
jgi:hypothetical protein